MDKPWLASPLSQGRSIESIARDLGRHPSSVAYWVHEHGLSSLHAERHAPRGGIDRERLVALIDEGLSIRGIASRLGVSYATVRHWLQRHDLQTRRAQRLAIDPGVLVEPVRPCPAHGPTPHARASDGYLRCRR